MSRSERLLNLLQLLRQYRRPVSGQVLADGLGISVRTLYRDISSLQAQGAQIDGEPGVGYVLKPGFTLPPLMFSATEIEALVLGIRWVANRTDGGMADAARSALAKISAVLPAELRLDLETSALLIGKAWGAANETVSADLLRQAIRTEQKLKLSYQGGTGSVSQRVVWPFALTYFDQSRVLLCWCELRGGFRHFRTDRITEADQLAARYPRARQRLLRDWKASAGYMTEFVILPETDSM
jgi:predicted DNA-binding transcriptional regulator YafY